MDIWKLLFSFILVKVNKDSLCNSNVIDLAEKKSFFLTHAKCNADISGWGVPILSPRTYSLLSPQSPLH
jgi:hypothetical protein